MCATNYNCGHALGDHLRSISAQFCDIPFEHVVVDNYSSDESAATLSEWARSHPNFRWFQRRCTRGRGRELAVRASSAPWILIVDTDTVYFPILRRFVERSISWHRDLAVQAVYAGVYPRSIWRKVGGCSNLNVGEDFDMWMRLWRIGRIRWYPVRMGENRKEDFASDRHDFLSSRYTRVVRLRRVVRTGFDRLQLVHYERLDLGSILRENTIDLDLGPMGSSWFGEYGRSSLGHKFRTFARMGLMALGLR